MFSVTFWYLLISVMSGTIQAQIEEQCVGCWEIGEQQNITCKTSNFTDAITLQLKVNNEFVNVSSCNTLGECTDYMSPVYETRSFGLVDIDGEEKYDMEIYISGARRNEATFRCAYDDQVINAFCYEMFARPSEPACDPPSLVNSDKEMSITCRTDNVYPDALMEASMHQKDLTVRPKAADVQCETSPSQTYPEYNATQCRARFSLSVLKPGEYQMVAGMYPHLSNVTRALEEIVHSGQNYSVLLNTPEVRLADDCPIDTYIVSGTCRCEIITNSTEGYSLGQAKWCSQTGQEVGTENFEDKSSTMNVTYDPSDPTPDYECRADTVLDVSTPMSVSYYPKFAYGPNSVIIEISEGWTFNFCPSEKHTTTVTCRVPQLEVEPGVNLTTAINNVTVIDHQPGRTIGHDYVQDYNFRPSKGGNYTVTCEAENTISATLSVSNSTTLEVREPPPSAPVFVIPPNQPGSDVANVVPGETIDITCKVDGGYPQVSEVTIICGSRKEQVQGDIAVLIVNVTSTTEGQTCYCFATHISGCYDKLSHVSLKIQENSDDNQGVHLTFPLIIVPPAAAAVVIVALVAVIIVLCMRLRRKSPDPPKNDGLGNHSTPSNPKEDDYITPRTPVPSDYAKIIVDDDTGLSSGDWNYSNPTFTDSHNYDRISDVFTPTELDNSGV